MEGRRWTATIACAIGLLAAAATLTAGWVANTGQRSEKIRHLTCGESCGEQSPPGCTVFTLAKGDQVFFAGNDDFITPDSYYWVDPGGDGTYGAIWVGPPENVQQGVNEMGLAYDANGLPRRETNPHTERPDVPGDYTSYPILMLRENATVAEVVDWVKTHQWHPYMVDQMHFADAGGDAVVISAGPGGELVFTRKPAGDGFLLSTNFNLADPTNGQIGWRYSAAERALAELVEQPGSPTYQDVAGVLAAVHVAGSDGWTRSSLLADLPNGKVLLYYFYQFDQPLVLDIEEQMAHPPDPGPLSQLFPPDVQQEAARRFQRNLRLEGVGRALGLTWLGLIGASVVGFALLAKGGRRTWLPAVVILGPLGLLGWGMCSRGVGAGGSRSAIAEAIGDATPTVLGFMVMLLLMLTNPTIEADEGLQVALLLGLPILSGLLLYSASLLSRAAKVNVIRLIGLRLPHVIVAATLGLAGTCALAIPLLDRAARIFPIMPIRVATLGVIWGVVVMSALPTLVFLYAYQGWAVRRGFHAWSEAAVAEDKISTPPWRRLWWWIPLSLAAMLFGLATSQYLQQL